MSIDFHSQENKYTYATRTANESWARAVTAAVDPRGKRVVDVGCGGGIYSQAWADLGAQSVTGIDFSEQMVAAAREKAGARSRLSFQTGTAQATGLAAGAADIVFERALIHHLKDYEESCAEAWRLLAPGGTLLIQDRTPEDVGIPGSPTHIRGYFFDCFPRLSAVEAGRRPTDAKVRAALHKAGFQSVESATLWETRRVYAHFDDLAQDLASRTGRSILHELSDEELRALIAHIGERTGRAEPVEEQDRWTLWIARR
ncbi:MULTISPECIES: bifunctional 2-polyprenyl-6-hydroxyphenol methylase/3-demethylubiquinol 3-O-methyltransferase UbiG [unclassified Achromobacter]|uniref:class I SAM-dependent methyltransferase n=1 Tax=unclassified Achromobacter TaxID=2626865 RepID=UPI000B51D2A1|nr:MULTISPECIES: class I SAM-dependent methyltransferase [unclassified Achromobacter]OWT75507.1 SAM-dependent methyltransferase [Achromobacter sp. HZ28]OWT76167.1 SAM-dependent methyltransferase [Achromobacter sp. HZ34]